MSSGLPPASSSDSQFDYQVTGRRIVAALLDIILLTILFLVMAAAFGDFGSTDDDGNGFSVNLTGGPFLVYLVLVYGYYVVFEGVAATTLGKMIMGLKVVKLNGDRYDWGAVLLRNILRIIDGLPVFYIVGLICVAVTRKKQRVGDLAAGTLVVRAQ